MIRLTDEATGNLLRTLTPANVGNTYYMIGSVVGPHPYPLIVRDYQAVIGREARAQMLEQTGRLPHSVVACVGGGSNSMGIFHPFTGDATVRLVGVEAGGRFRFLVNVEALP